MTKTSIAFLLFLLLLASPYIYVFKAFSSFSLDGVATSGIYLYSCAQALASAVFTLMMAVPGALGLFWLKSRARPALVASFEFAILLPSLLPGLFIVVSFLNVIPGFPFGIGGVVLLHGFSEVGLGAIIVHRILHQELGAYMDGAELMGTSPFRFLKSAVPLMAPSLGQVLAILFLFFLSSLSIPLILAGGRYATLEAAMYQQVLSLHDWNQALNLFLVQAVFLALGFVFLGRFQGATTDPGPGKYSSYLAWPLGLVVLIFPVAVVLISLLIRLPVGLIALGQQATIMDGWAQYLAGSLLTGFLVGGGSFVGLSALCYFYQRARLRKFFSLIMTPSLVMLAFAFFLLPGTSGTALFAKVSLALTIGFLPALMRFGFLKKVESLSTQVESVALLGASSGKIFWRGLFPQVLPQISLLSGLASVWAMGDFAISKIIAGRDITLAMWVQSLVDQYRWDMALVLSWMILLASFAVFGFFWSLSYVSHKKLNEVL